MSEKLSNCGDEVLNVPLAEPWGTFKTAAVRGAEPCNTAPSKYIDSTLKVLNTGIDTLDISYPGTISPSLCATLDHYKQFAQSSDSDDKANAQLQIGDHLFQVLPFGRGKFSYHLCDNHYQISISSSRAKSLPLAYCQISSELLFHAGVNRAVSELATLLGELTEHSIDVESISRADIYSDFVCDAEILEHADGDWVSRANYHATHRTNGVRSGVSFGRGGPITCRIYDKTKEIREQSSKTYLYEKWRQQGWDLESKVLRCEFQLRSEFLREIGVYSLHQLQDCMESTWGWLTNDWLRLSIPTGDTNRSRWPTLPLWRQLQDSNFSESGQSSMYRAKNDRAPGDRFLFMNGLASMTSFMAREGLASIVEAFPMFLNAAIHFHGSEGQLENYAFERTIEKAVRYNKPIVER